MRGHDHDQSPLFSYLSPDQRVPTDHPLRAIRAMVDTALVELSHQFDDIYADTGRPSIPPEKLIRALLVQILYSVRSERQLMEQMDYNLLFRWFVGLSMDEPVWHASTFSKNRDRLIASTTIQCFFLAVVQQARSKNLLSEEHFSVDGTLIEAWASIKSFRPRDEEDQDDDAPKGRNGWKDFKGQKLSNATHESRTDPDARLYRKSPGQPAKLSYIAHGLMENRHGLYVDVRLTQADGYAERSAALDMMRDRRKARTLGADKGYDTADFVSSLRQRGITPHVARKAKGSAIDGRTTRHAGYEQSQRIRKRVEEGFGWIKTVGRMAKTRFRGLARVEAETQLHLAAWNLIRMRSLAA